MPTLIERCNELAKTFIETKNKKYAAKIIVREIDSLLYSTSKQPIDFTIKRVMVQVIYELISGRRAFSLPTNKVIRIKQKDILKFSKLENYILQELWCKHELKERELQIEVNQSKISVKTFTLTFHTAQNSDN